MYSNGVSSLTGLRQILMNSQINPEENWGECVPCLLRDSGNGVKLGPVHTIMFLNKNESV